MKVEAYRDECEREIFCVVTFENNSYTEYDVLLNEEYIRSVALEEAKTEREKDIVLHSEFIIVQDNGEFYVEFRGFVE